MSTLFAAVVLAVALNAAGVAAAPENLVFAKSACADFCVTAQLTNGSPVVMAPCDSANVTDITWSFDTTAASAQIKLTKGTVTKCLDVTDGKNTNGAKLQVWSCVDNANQKFRIDTDDTDAVITWDAHPEKCVDLTDGREAAGTPVQIWNCNDDNDNQVWDLSPSLTSPPATRPVETTPDQQRPPETGFSTIKLLINSTTTAAGGPKCLGFASKTNGAKAIITSCVSETTTLNAAWSTREPVTISDNTAAYCLDAKDGTAASGTKLQAWQCNPTNKNQQWRFNADGTITWGTTNFCIDLTDGNKSDGTQVQIWSCNKNTNQVWTPAAVIP